MANPFDDLPPHAYDPNTEADLNVGPELPDDGPLPFDDNVPYAPYESPARNNVLNEPTDFDPDAEPEDAEGEKGDDALGSALVFDLRLRSLGLAREERNDAGLPLDADALIEAAKKIESYLYS